MNDYETQPPSYTMLIVDDMPENIDLLRAILAPHYKVRVATGGERALKIVESDTPPDLILLDVMMPDLDGYEVCRRIKALPHRRNIPIMFVTSMETQEDEEKGLSLGAEDYITKPFRPSVVLARVRTHLALYDQTRDLERRVDVRTRELQATRLEIIRRLGRAAEFRDNETGRHVIRMSHFSRLIALAAGLDARQAELLFLAAPMHDIGKIGVPDYVLLKPGRLDTEEWRLMQQHAAIGAEILGDHPDELLQIARTVALTHHEKWDGSGYPQGLRGREIPREGHIVALADVFDALTSARPYKQAWPIERAVATIMEGAGSHFDPDLLQAFQKALPDMLAIREQYQEHSDAAAIPPQRQVRF
ncbi:response regulator [Curvibacter sp. APW13]|uniref:response regulator n=1 Tax=Curvibacter sp. APW13 TaxID=3077236 RepID=UPI0028DECA3E|nr:HD domain-containing phosphohydrolase [Curvibacter sp. APW13]MDT8992296.1 response regulator [Curvibacter sp. APW13]